MGAKADLVNEQETILTGMDSIVIRNYLGGIMNGRTLDMTGFKQSVIKAGHIVIRDTENDTYKPMPVNSEAQLTNHCHLIMNTLVLLFVQNLPTSHSLVLCMLVK